jgi:hypothetical protein
MYSLDESVHADQVKDTAMSGVKIEQIKLRVRLEGLYDEDCEDEDEEDEEDEWDEGDEEDEGYCQFDDLRANSSRRHARPASLFRHTSPHARQRKRALVAADG